MVRFGGNEFVNCSVPLAFEGRYFILEHGDPVMVSVILEHDGRSIFEVMRNEPAENPLTDVSKSPPGIVTVIDKNTGMFLYKVRPGSETSVVFGKIGGGEISVKINDKSIVVGTNRFTNNLFNGVSAGIVVNRDGSISVGGPIPPFLVQDK